MDPEKQDVMEKTYALVTGAGQGIGMAFCRALARRNHALIMVSLPGEELAVKSAEITERYGVETKIYETDLTSESNCIALHEWVKNKGYLVDILINNAGIGSAGPFEDFNTSFYTRQISLNALVPVWLTRLFLPELREREKAYILNLGSMGGFFHMPNKEVYNATKAFILSFTKSLQNSLQKSHVSVTVICPGPVDSNPRLVEIHKNMKGLAKKAVWQPDDVAEAGIIALMEGKKVFIPGRVNRFFLFLDSIVPAFMKNAILLREMQRQEKVGIPH